MSDKTAAELVADFVRNRRKMNQLTCASDLGEVLRMTEQRIQEEMEEWYEERQQQIEER